MAGKQTNSELTALRQTTTVTTTAVRKLTGNNCSDKGSSHSHNNCSHSGQAAVAAAVAALVAVAAVQGRGSNSSSEGSNS